jgi:gluconate 2-dehydrogenase gamma chain
MSNDETISRRTALKIIGVGVGVASAPNVFAQHPHPHTGVEMVSPVDEQPPGKLHFFTPAQMVSITLMSDLIIPSDEQSPGAKDAGVPAFVDLMVSESSVETKNLWRNGLAAIDQLCNKEFGHAFGSLKSEQQVAVLKLISRNEYQPRKIEERFFVAIKGLTVDGYYTSELGIHQELQYKGNAYLKDFAGCTHPEHKS